MDEMQRRKIRMRISTASLVVLLVAAVCLIGGLLAGFLPPVAFRVGIGILLFLYWFVNDILEAKLTRILEDATLEQRKSYTKYVLFDAVGYIGLAYFAFSIGENSSAGLVGVVIYALTMSMKRKMQEEFDYLGKVARGEIQPEENEESEENEEAEEGDSTEADEKTEESKQPKGAKEPAENENPKGNKETE